MAPTGAPLWCLPRRPKPSRSLSSLPSEHCVFKPSVVHTSKQQLKRNRHVNKSLAPLVERRNTQHTVDSKHYRSLHSNNTSRNNTSATPGPVGLNRTKLSSTCARRRQQTPAVTKQKGGCACELAQSRKLFYLVPFNQLCLARCSR